VTACLMGFCLGVWYLCDLWGWGVAERVTDRMLGCASVVAWMVCAVYERQ